MGEREINRIKKIILRNFHSIGIDKVILFGSTVKKNFTAKSDIDLIILSKAFRNKTLFEKSKMANNLEWDLINATDKPFDLLYYSDEEWENTASLMIAEAKKNGKVIYEN